MATAADVLREARKTIGMTESPRGSNRQPFAGEAGHANGQPWCASWIVAIARRARLKLPSESAYTPAMADGFRRIGRFDRTPRVGSIAFFDFPDSKHRIQHVAYVELVNTDGSVVTIEGNTSSGNSGSQDNGGCVARRHRSMSVIVGFGHPVYAEEDWFDMATKADLEQVINKAVGAPLSRILDILEETVDWDGDGDNERADGIKLIRRDIATLRAELAAKP